MGTTSLIKLLMIKLFPQSNKQYVLTALAKFGY